MELADLNQYLYDGLEESYQVLVDRNKRARLSSYVEMDRVANEVYVPPHVCPGSQIREDFMEYLSGFVKSCQEVM